jgi:hypothetical protein
MQRKSRAVAIGKISWYWEGPLKFTRICSLCRWVWLGPWLLLGILFAAIFWASKLAITTLVVVITLTFLPAGNVRPAMKSDWIESMD